MFVRLEEGGLVVMLVLLPCIQGSEISPSGTGRVREGSGGLWYSRGPNVSSFYFKPSMRLCFEPGLEPIP